MTEALVLFREVDIKGAVLPEKVIYKNTREALTRWNISWRGLTTAVARSHSILVRRLLYNSLLFFMPIIDFELGSAIVTFKNSTFLPTGKYADVMAAGSRKHVNTS